MYNELNRIVSTSNGWKLVLQRDLIRLGATGAAALHQSFLGNVYQCVLPTFSLNFATIITAVIGNIPREPSTAFAYEDFKFTESN